MKRHYICLILLMVFLGLSSCQRDFDPANSKIQTVYFNIDPRGCFSNIPYMSGDSIQIGLSDEMDANHQMRISAFCYGQDSVLITQTTTVRDNIGPVRIELEHVDISQPIICHCIVDFVHIAPWGILTYWHMLETQNLNTFYLYNSEQDSELRYLSVLHAIWVGYCKDITITMKPLPLNTMGFCRMVHIKEQKQIECFMQKSIQLNIGKEKSLGQDDLLCYQESPHCDTCFFPVMINNTDDIKLYIKNQNNYSSYTDSLFFRNINKPFFINYDASSPTKETYIMYYE